MITVTLHFPHADFEGIELPAVPSRGDNFWWYEQDTAAHSKWTVSEVDWSASRFGPYKATVALVLDPADEDAERASEAHQAEGIAAARAAAAEL